MDTDNTSSSSTDNTNSSNSTNTNPSNNTNTESSESIKSVEYQYMHDGCRYRSYCTCTFRFDDYPCTLCGTIMEKLPLKKLYCVDCANEKKLCPFTFCQNN